MRRQLGRSSIQKRLVATLMASSATVAILATTGYTAYEVMNFRQQAGRELVSVGTIVAANSTAALLFRDKRAARENLESLRFEKNVTAATILDAAQTVFTSYHRVGHAVATELPQFSDGIQLEEDRLILRQGIFSDGERLGTLILEAELVTLGQILARDAQIAFPMTALILMVALLVSRVLARRIASPILELAETAAKVSEEQDFHLRAKVTTEDEVGLLGERFNQMLEAIATREEELASYREHLESKVDQRTRELQEEIEERMKVEEELRSAKEQAEASSRAKGAFLANMSHELRTPMNAIIGYTEMLRDELGEGVAIDREQWDGDMSKILSAARHLLGMINEILDTSKLEAGMMTMRLDWTDARQLAREAVETTAVLAKANGNRIEWHIEDGVHAVYADSLRLKQCVLNLLSNAAKFTSGGTIRLSVHRATLQAGNWIRWTVTDTGIGISAEDLPKLFQSFSQLESPEAKKHSGTGLGLAITKKMIEQMGGQVWVESVKGQGTSFHIDLPEIPLDPASPAGSAAEDTLRLGHALGDDPQPKDRHHATIS